jgi:hypothetical protein
MDRAVRIIRGYAAGETYVKRRLFNLAAAVSLMLWVAVCVLWVRSYWASDNLLYATDRSLYCGGSLDGTVYLGSQIWRDKAFHLAHSTAGDRFEPSIRTRRRSWIRLETSESSFMLWIPDRVLISMLGALSVAGLRRRRRRHLIAASGTHTCPTCGYDLRATPQRCPECGAVPEAPPATAA